MASQFSNGVFAKDVINVDFGIFASRGNEIIFGPTTKTTVDGVVALSYAGVLTDEALLFDTP